VALDYLETLQKIDNECANFYDWVARAFFQEGKSKTCTVPDFYEREDYVQRLKPIEACMHICKTLNLQVFGTTDNRAFEESLTSLRNNPDIEELEGFRLAINMVRGYFAIVRDSIMVFCASFDEEERLRINEAVHNYLERCNYSCIAMSVSAVESRLLRLMCTANPAAEEELSKGTLGRLITEYVSDKGKYRNVVPKRHETLLQLCNTYRVFSVHPKRHRISHQVTTSIFNLSLEFLTDPNTKVDTPTDGNSPS